MGCENGGTPFPTLASPTHNLSLRQVLQRLERHDAVEGIVLIGSTARTTIPHYSDYDLLLFLREMPVELWLMVTTIESRLTDLVFFSDTVLNSVLERDKPFQAHDAEAPLAHWLSTGRLVFDRSGRLQQAQMKLKRGKWLAELSDTERYAYWHKVNYNVLQARRMVDVDNLVYRIALNLRLLYSLYEVWLAYFHLRDIPWHGDKPAIKYLMENDAAFLQLLQEAMDESSLSRKVALYETAAEQALAPLDGLWTTGTTTVRLQQNEHETPANLQAGLNFWKALLTTSNTDS
jgi:predicted nucleotidyltransferase